MDPGPLGIVDAMIFLWFKHELEEPSCDTPILRDKKQLMLVFTVTQRKYKIKAIELKQSRIRGIIGD